MKMTSGKVKNFYNLMDTVCDVKTMTWPQFRFILLMPGKGELPASETSLFVSLQQEKNGRKRLSYMKLFCYVVVTIYRL